MPDFIITGLASLGVIALALLIISVGFALREAQWKDRYQSLQDDILFLDPKLEELLRANGRDSEILRWVRWHYSNTARNRPINTGSTLRESFEEMCRRQRIARPVKRGEMTFGEALEAIKAGGRVARDGWNSKGMWVALSGTELRPARVQASGLWSPHSRAEAEAQGGSVEVLPALIMRTADGEIAMGWLASQADMLANDWILLTDH